MGGERRKGTSGASDRTKSTSGMDSSDKEKRSKLPLPELPLWEIALCFGIWFGHAAYAWFTVWTASIQYENRLYSGFFEPGWSLLNYRKRDVSNYEWMTWLPSLPMELAGFLLHTVSLRLVDRMIKEKWKSEAIMTLVWIVVLFMKLGWVGLATTFVHGALMLAVARVTQWKLAVWFCACCLLATLASEWYPLNGDTNLHYRFAVYVAYKLLHFISFCVYDIDVKRGKIVKKEDGEKEVVCPQSVMSAYYTQMRYTLYPPYSSILIVNYLDFADQWDKRQSIIPDYKRVAVMSVRLAFWTVINDLILHFFYMNAMIVDQYFLKEVDLITLCAIGFTAGQYFHMKYVSIFGINTVFAILDGMSPSGWPPICISRVALYSNMWRYFDRGLYAFLRDQIFLPIAKPSFSIWRRVFASFVCFAFVWLWHGMTSGFLWWVGMNFVEITLENLAKEIYNLPSVHNWMHSRFSLVNLRRIRALCHIVCISWGVFSIFFFLGGSGVGNVFVQRLIIGESLRLNPPFLYLVILGYFFAQSCMEVEAMVGPM